MFYFILILLAMLAIFDTQVLSIFRRQKEIGTYIAMGMTRRQVVSLFTVEGAMHAILAVILGAIYGIPFLLWQINTGFTMPAGTDDMGIAIAETIFPVYGIGLIKRPESQLSAYSGCNSRCFTDSISILLYKRHHGRYD